MTQSPASISPQAQGAIHAVNRLQWKLFERTKEIVDLFKYFDGVQPLLYATEQWKIFHEDRFKGFSDNWCAPVGQAPVDRLKIDGFRLGDDATSELEKSVWADWNSNEMTAQANQGFLASVVARRSFSYVWGDNDGNPVIFWEHPSQVIIEEDAATKQPRYALKIWRDGNDEFAILQSADAVWKFRRHSVVPVVNGVTPNGLVVQVTDLAHFGWEPWQELSDDTWPLPNPVGEVTFTEWKNRPRLDGTPRSDIEGVIGMQNAVNLMWAYLFAAADYASMPARIVLGEPPKMPILNESGEIIGTKPVKLEDLAQGRMLFLPGAEKTDSWEAASLDVFTKVINEAIAHIAAQTSTPGHYLMMNQAFANLNADALTAAEVPLTVKVENQQLHFSPAAKRTIRLARLVRGDKAGADLIAATGSTKFVQWRNAAMRSMAQVSDAAAKARALGMSLSTILERYYNFTEVEIENELDRIAAEQDDGLSQALTKTFTSLQQEAPVDNALLAGSGD